MAVSERKCNFAAVRKKIQCIMNAATRVSCLDGHETPFLFVIIHFYSHKLE